MVLTALPTVEMLDRPSVIKLDTAEQFSNLDNNKGYEFRRDLVQKSRTLAMYFRVRTPINNCSQFLPPFCNLQYTFIQSADSFRLICLDDVKDKTMSIKSCKMFYKKCEIANSLFSSILKRNMSHPLVYNVRRSEVQRFEMSESKSVLTETILNNTKLPILIIVGVFNSKAVRGDYTLSPFETVREEDNYLESVYVSCEGVNFPAEPYTNDIDKGDHVRAYSNLVES